MLLEWMDEREPGAEADAGDGETQALLTRVMEEVLRGEGEDGNVVVGVTLVDGERIRELNRAFRGVDRVTDVLSFPLVEGRLRDAAPADLTGLTDPETGALELGDLVICPARAREQAEEYGHGVRREMGYLAAHGLLHLLGYDHETDEERAEMREKEEAALAACDLKRE
ncbi:MAG: rRNA maturation RNase YbeY [Candidatus Spyradocola sp.]|jgi:probable rRNA maturation factor